MTKGTLLGVKGTNGAMTAIYEVLSVDVSSDTLEAKCIKDLTYKRGYGVKSIKGEIKNGPLSSVFRSITNGRVVYIENALQRLKKRYKRRRKSLTKAPTVL